MVQKTIKKYLRPRHYWRDISFDELSQLYISMMFRKLALSLVGVFVPIYLYKLGYSLSIILIFYGIFYITQGVGNIIACYVTAGYGPKRTMALSYILQVLALIMLLAIENTNLPIWNTAVIWGLSNGVFNVAYHVNFSKIKDSAHGGKEIGYMNIVEKLGGTIGPLLGGILATLYSAEYTFLAAIAFFIIGMVPLTMSGEPTKTGQKVKLEKLDIRPIMRDLLVSAGMSTNHSIASVVWPLYLVAIVFADKAYLKMGGLATMSAVTIIAVSYLIGRMIDNKQGRILLRVGAISSALVHLGRLLVVNIYGAAVISLGQELTETAARMPFTRGMYGAADRHESNRIKYILAFEMFASAWKSIIMFVLAITAAMFYSGTFTIAFIIAASGSLLVTTEKFPALNKRKV